VLAPHAHRVCACLCHFTPSTVCLELERKQGDRHLPCMWWPPLSPSVVLISPVDR
jgi:hypothetical protein